MKLTVTKNDVLRYFYGEISKNEKFGIEEALAFSSELQNYYCELISMNQKLSKMLLNVKDKTVENILMYSKSLSLQN